MIRAFRIIREATPEERAAAFGHAWWALPLTGIFFALLWIVTP